MNKIQDFWRWCALCKDYFVVGEHDHNAHNELVDLRRLRARLIWWIVFILIVLVAVLFWLYAFGM